MTDWLLDTLIATSALMILVMLLRRPIREHFGSRAAYALWLLPAGRALMPPISETVTRMVPAAGPSIPNAFLPLASAEPQLLPVTTPPGQALMEALGGWPTIMMTIWLGVAIGILVRGLGDYRRQRRQILDTAVQLARLGSIRMVRSTAVSGPLAFGLIDRVIALPPDFEHRYSERERCLALDHELAHHRHGDLFANSFAFVLLSLQWFNPLAWWSYAAFRFDQEAACDARVLDKAMPRDRADYGRAIAKAASGRALLLASALDQEKTLHRRLKSMLNKTPKSRRILGTAAIVAAAAIALPLTATRAVNYVDVTAPEAPQSAAAAAAASSAVEPVSAARPVALIQAAVDRSLGAILPVSAVAGVAATDGIEAADDVDDPDVQVGEPDISMIGNDSVRINGRTKRWSELTVEERRRIRADTAKARMDLAKSRDEMARSLAQAKNEMHRIRNGDFEREMVNARAEVASALREIDESAAEMRKAGVDPEKIKAEVRASLAEVEKIDVEKIKRETMAELDPEKMKASLREAERSLADIERKLDRLERGERW